MNQTNLFFRVYERNSPLALPRDNQKTLFLFDLYAGERTFAVGHTLRDKEGTLYRILEIDDTREEDTFFTLMDVERAEEEGETVHYLS